MTICLSAICERGEAVVFCSDKLLTAGYLTAEFEHPGSKAYSLGQSCVGLAAGDALISGELFRSSAESISQLHSPPVHQIAENVSGIFLAIRKARAEGQLLKPRGFTLYDFYGGGLITRLPPEIAFNLDQGIQNARLDVAVILAGIDPAGAHIYGVFDPGIVDCYDGIGYHAVGSGEIHAMLTLISREHRVENLLNRTAYLVYEAKRKAEVAPGVGNETEMGAITRSGVKMFTVEEMALLEKAYQTVLAPSRTTLEQAIDGLPFALENQDATRQEPTH